MCVMGVSMKYARLAQNNLRVSASEYQSTCGSVICNYCSAQVYHKKSYKKGLNTIVPAHFCIWPRQKHEQTCLYNLDRVGREILAGVADNSIIQQNNCLIIRLLFIDYKYSQSGGQKEDLSQKAKTNEPKYISEGKLSPYISSLCRLYKIRRTLINDDRNFHRTFKLKFGDKKISWHDFVFEKKDFPRLYEYIQRGKLTHPICIVGKYEVKYLKDLDKKKIQFKYSYDRKYYVVECFLDRDNEIEKSLNLEKKPFALMYLDQVSCRNDKETDKNNTYINIDGKLRSKKQIYIFDE